MSFALFLCGPRVGALGDIAPALVEEIAGRGIAAQVLCTVATATPGVTHAPAGELAAHLQRLGDMDAAAVVLLPERDRAAREALIALAPEAVVVDWCQPDDPGFEPSDTPHASVMDEQEVLAGMAQVFAVLEGLGYLPFASRGALNPAQDAELVAKLKELGYV